MIRFSHLIIPLLTLLSLLSGGCSNHAETVNDVESKADRAAIDSLLAGNSDFYNQWFETEKRNALSDNDSDRWAECLIQEGIAAFYMADPQTMMVKSDSALTLLLSRPLTPRRATAIHRAYMTKGGYFSQYNFNADSTVFYHRKGVEFARLAGRGHDYAIALGNLADSYKLISRLAEASDYYHRAIHVADSIGSERQDYIPLYGGLAATYTQLRDFEQSREWWNRTMELYDVMIPFERFNNLNNLGNDFYYRKEYPQALATFKRLSSYLDSLPHAEWERNFVNVNLADSYLYLQQPDSAAPLITSSLAYFSDVQPNPVALVYLHTLLMRLYMERGNYAAVEELIERYPFSDTLRAEQQTSRLQVMTDYYTKTHQWHQAYTTREHLNAIDDTLRSERVSQLAAARRIQYSHDTEMLRLRGDQQATAARNLRLSLIIFLAIVVIAALAVLMVVMRLRTRRRDEKIHSDMIALRMQSVRTRITPHFIFNALNHEVLARQTGHPSRLKSIVALLRHQQYVAEELITPLSDELAFVDDYVAVERDAVEGPFEYTVAVSDDINPDTTLGPSMTIQILVENAFKHGFRLMPPEAPKRLVVDARTDSEGNHVITVFGNSSPASVQLAPRPAKGSGTGLKIIMQTLSFINTRLHADLRFDSRSGVHPIWGEGVWSILTIPKDTDLSSLSAPAT